ncbi:MAG: hypothetical protein S0880_07415 [Actinomycetota bacterium]|nr:hypothetical protein [Actinomycetota bacterium]
MVARVPSTSVEKVWLPVRQDHPIDGPVDLTGFDVEVAFIDRGAGREPEPGDWQTAAWEATAWTDPDEGLTWWLAYVTVGAGDLDLDVDAYQGWARVDSTAVVKGGRLMIIDR